MRHLEYKKNKYLTHTARELLSKQLNTPPITISYWFAKQRRVERLENDRTNKNAKQTIETSMYNF